MIDTKDKLHQEISSNAAIMENVKDWRAAIPFVPVFEDDILIVYEMGLN